MCCTQIRRATTQVVCNDTKTMWGLDEDSHDDHRSPDTILPGCKVLMLDEVHSGSTDVELILARILPRIPHISQFRLVLMSATLNVDAFYSRLLNAGIEPKDIAIFQMEERTHPLSLHCLSPERLRERDNVELAVRMILKLHHECPATKNGPILVFVPGRAEIRLMIELIKNALKRGYTSNLWPYRFHADTPAKDRSFLTSCGRDPDPSRYGELANYNRGKKATENHPCNASKAAQVKNPTSLPSRRVIIATNAAETTVTFKDCWAVIDTCLVNQMVYDPCIGKDATPCNYALSKDCVQATCWTSREDNAWDQYQADHATRMG